MIRKLSARTSGMVCLCLLTLICFVLICCNRMPPSITFTEIPPTGVGGSDTKAILAGHVTGFKSGQHIVLYARAGDRWWIQPYAYAPYTDIKPDGTWSAEVHLGGVYAATLVAGNDTQKKVLTELPPVGGRVRAVATVPGIQSAIPPELPKLLHFDGYDWEVRADSGGFGGKQHQYASSNVWLDAGGAMHLRTTLVGKQWVCAETHAVRTLGYGTYRWRIRDVSHLEPAAMLSMFTWAGLPEQHHREIDIHVSRWGDPISRSGEYVIQPYYLPANVYRFDAPPGVFGASFRWTLGRVDFATYSGKNTGKPLASWSFTSGVPASSDENISINLCEFGYAKHPLQHDIEVVIEQFEFLP